MHDNVKYVLKIYRIHIKEKNISLRGCENERVKFYPKGPSIEHIKNLTNAQKTFSTRENVLFWANLRLV